MVTAEKLWTCQFAEHNSLTKADFEIPTELIQRWKNAGYTEEDIQLIRKLMRPGLPGERPPGKRGRDTKWTSELHHQLILDVLELTGGEEKKISTSAACLMLAKREPWLSLVETLSTKRDPADVLRERYVRLYMAAFDIYEDVKTGELEVKIREKNKKHGGKYQ